MKRQPPIAERDRGRVGPEYSMSYRAAKLSHVVRDVVSDAIANHVWDPRVTRFTSVTRVEMSPDLRSASVFVSVMGSDVEADTTMKGLQSARGMIQTRLARRLDLRKCPIIQFRLDTGLKAAIETGQRLEQIRAEASRHDSKSPEVGEPSPPEVRDNPTASTTNC